MRNLFFGVLFAVLMLAISARALVQSNTNGASQLATVAAVQQAFLQARAIAKSNQSTPSMSAAQATLVLQNGTQVTIHAGANANSPTVRTFRLSFPVTIGGQTNGTWGITTTGTILGTPCPTPIAGAVTSGTMTILLPTNTGAQKATSSSIQQTIACTQD